MVETLPPLLAAGVRFGTAGAIFLLVLRLRGGPGKVRVTRAELLGAALIGTLLCFGGNGLVTVAERDVPSGLAALIMGAMPLWVLLMRAGHGDRVPRATLAGAAVGRARGGGRLSVLGVRRVLLAADAAPAGRARLHRLADAVWGCWHADRRPPRGRGGQRARGGLLGRLVDRARLPDLG